VTKRVPLTMGQGEMEEEEGKSETPLTLPHGCFATLAVSPSTLGGLSWKPLLLLSVKVLTRISGGISGD